MRSPFFQSSRWILFLAALCLVSFTSANAQVTGTWREPGGSVIEIAPCASGLCAKLLAIRANAPASVDAHNPDASLRTRALCGLTIGTGFHLENPNRAEGGKLYDPESGKTYSGAMNSVGNALHLRGYVGIKLFGRSETWQRTSAPSSPCKL